MQGSLAILGFGTMGQTLATGLLETGSLPAGNIIVTDKGKGPRAKAMALGLTWGASPSEAAKGASTVILAVKPRDLSGLLASLNEAEGLSHRPLVISIAAGVTMASLEGSLPQDTPVVRAMPNTPCAVRRGTTVLVGGRHSSPHHLARAQEIFEPLGAVLELEEHHMNAVTSLSGSGPAFQFVILEALAEGGVACGLPRGVALELAARMTLGAAAMVLETGRHPAALKDDVTTPAGCTIAGLLALEDGRLRSVLARGVSCAAQVAGELSQ